MVNPKSDTDLQQMPPSLLVEQTLLGKVSIKEGHSFLDLILGEHLAAEIPLEHVLQPEKQRLGELSATALKVRVDLGRLGRVLEVVSCLQTTDHSFGQV